MGATQSSGTENVYKEYIKQQHDQINAQQEYIKKLQDLEHNPNIIFKENKPKLNPYQILGIENHNINERDLKKAYLKKAYKCHPDKGGNKDNFQKLTIAYTILLNKIKDNNNSDHNQMKSANKTFSENQPTTNQLDKKFDIELFNKIYDDNKISTVYDNGYGDWMKNNNNISEQPKLYTNNFNRELFNDEFLKYKKSTTNQKNMVKYVEPELNISYQNSSSIMTLGQGNIGDFSTENACDYRAAFENNFLIDIDQYSRDKNFKNINDIERDRSLLSYTPSATDLLYTQNKMLNDKKEEEERRRRLQNNDEVRFLQYNKLNKRFLNS